MVSVNADLPGNAGLQTGTAPRSAAKVAYRQPRRSAGDGLERRPPVGTARRRRAEPRIAPQPHGARQRSAGLRPASRGSAKSAPMTLRYANMSAAPPISCGWSAGWERRSSGRHRPAQRSETGYRRPRGSAGTAWNADLRPVLPVGVGTAPRSGARRRTAQLRHSAPLGTYRTGQRDTPGRHAALHRRRDQPGLDARLPDSGEP